MASKRAPVIDIKTDFFKDHRIKALARRLSMPIETVQIRIIKLWATCRDDVASFATDERNEVRRAGWIVPDSVINDHLEHDGAAEALLAGGVEESALGIRVLHGIYLKGSEDTVRNILKLSATASSGGQKRANGANRAKGRFTSAKSTAGEAAGEEPAGYPANDQQPTSSPPASDQPRAGDVAGAPPARTSVLPLTPYPSPSGEGSINARVRERHPDAGRLAQKLWDAGTKLWVDLHAAGFTGKAPCPWPALISASSEPYQRLLDRCGWLLAGRTFEEAEALGLHRIAVERASAMRKRSDQFAGPMALWSEGGFMRALEMRPEHFADAPSAGSKHGQSVRGTGGIRNIPCTVKGTFDWEGHGLKRPETGS